VTKETHELELRPLQRALEFQWKEAYELVGLLTERFLLAKETYEL